MKVWTATEFEVVVLLSGPFLMEPSLSPPSDAPDAVTRIEKVRRKIKKVEQKMVEARARCKQAKQMNDKNKSKEEKKENKKLVKKQLSLKDKLVRLLLAWTSSHLLRIRLSPWPFLQLSITSLQICALFTMRVGNLPVAAWCMATHGSTISVH